jgi:hypothetical protein
MSNLEGILFYGDWTIEDIVNVNLIDYFKYGLLQIGGYYNITRNKLDYQNKDLSQLRPVLIPGISNYTVFRGNKHDWVWESNIDLKYSSGTQPISITGIVVNNTVYATGASINSTGFYIDYSRGQVVFGSSLSSGTLVQCPHTLRGVNIYPIDSNEYRDLEYEWNKVSNSSGITNFQEKAYLPAIFIGIEGFRTVKGVELGSRAKVSNFNIEFNIIASNSYELKKLIDICYFLETKTIPLYDWRTTPRPLNSRGELIYPTGNWKTLTENYLMARARFNEDFAVTKIRNSKLPISRARARISLQTDLFPT